jgi:hypothetical protein
MKPTVYVEYRQTGSTRQRHIHFPPATTLISCVRPVPPHEIIVVADGVIPLSTTIAQSYMSQPLAD